MLRPYQPSCGGPVFIQAVGSTSGANANLVVISSAFAKNNINGNTLILFYRQVNNIIQGGGSETVDDSQGNVWTQLPGSPWNDPTGQGTWIGAFICTNCRGGPNTVNLRFAGNGGAFLRFGVVEFANVTTPDANNHAINALTGNFDSGALVTAASVPLLLGAIQNATADTTYTVPGWTLAVAVDGNFSIYYRNNVPAGTYHFSGTTQAAVRAEPTAYAFH